MELSERIAAVRKTAGLTQEQMGDLVGVTRQAVSKWESGQAVPDALTVARLCEQLHVSADYLLLGVQPEGQPSGTEPEETVGPGTCPCCGREVPGTLCPVCGYSLLSHSDRGPKYALILKQNSFNFPGKNREQTVQDLIKYAGMSEGYAWMHLKQMQEYGSLVLARRGLSDTAVQWVTSHMDPTFLQLHIVEDCGESDEALLTKTKAMDPPPSQVKTESPVGFWGVVGAVIVALLILSFF